MVEEMPPLLASGVRACAAGALLATALAVRGGLAHCSRARAASVA